MMDANGMKHEAKLAGWTERVEECRKSGLSVREWCTERGVSVATYYRWEREVLSGMEGDGKEDKAEAETRFVNFGTASPSARGNKSTLTEIQVHCHG